MASEGRPPEDLQEAVAATLRRLRGEVGATGPRPAQRIEPQLSMPAASPEPTPGPIPGPIDEPSAPEPAESYIPEPAAPITPPTRRREPDLLSAVSQTDIPPIPSSQGQGSTTYEPVEEVTEEEYVAPRRHWLRYVAALIVLIAFAALGWWGYRHFAGRAGSGQVPVVAADQTPEKVPPADQPATQTQSQQETVYNQISPGSTAQQPEVLLPQPETPSTPPAPAAGATAPSTTAQGGTASGATAPSVPAVPAPPGSTTTGSTTTGNSTGTLTETLLPAESTPSTTAPAAGQSTTGATTTGQAAGTQTATTAPSAPATAIQGTTAPDQGTGDTGTVTAPAAPANDAPTAAGNYRVQLAALKTEADAKTAWKRLAAKYPDILGPLAMHLEKVDLGTKGIYYRVQAGPFTDKNAARDICTKLKPKGQPCLVKP
jgi:hypothetical protein